MSAWMQSPSDRMVSDSGLEYLVVIATVAESTAGLSTKSGCDDPCIVYIEHCWSCTDQGSFSPVTKIKIMVRANII